MAYISLEIVAVRIYICIWMAMYAFMYFYVSKTYMRPDMYTTTNDHFNIFLQTLQHVINNSICIVMYNV